MACGLEWILLISDMFSPLLKKRMDVSVIVFAYTQNAQATTLNSESTPHGQT
jgi:hypothetical protein